MSTLPRITPASSAVSPIDTTDPPILPPMPGIIPWRLSAAVWAELLRPPGPVPPPPALLKLHWSREKRIRLFCIPRQFSRTKIARLGLWGGVEEG